MALTNIATQKTPGRPIEIAFDAETGLPSANQELMLIGHLSATGGSASAYNMTQINNVSDADLAQTEAEAKFGLGSELAKMVVAAVKANEGRSTFPTIKTVPLANGDTGFGTSDVALTEVKKYKAEFVVSCYDATDATTRGKLKDACEAMSGAARVENNQYGSIGVASNLSVSDPSTLAEPDSLYLSLAWMRDTGTNPYSVAEISAAFAAVMAGNGVPFNPVNDFVIGGMTPPEKTGDWITVGAGMESETALNKGWTPLKVKSNGSDVAIVRSITARLYQSDGITPVTAYYDVQDFQTLYFWRKTLKTRFSQPDFANVKASEQKAINAKAEMTRLAVEFEDQDMFQNVSELAKQFKVERNASDRHRFDYITPVNVIPGLHVLAGRILATTQGDTITV